MTKPMKPDETCQVCDSCGLPRRVFVVFADRDEKHGEFQTCSRCAGTLVKPARPTLEPTK